MIRRNQGVTGHAAPGGQVCGSARIVCDDLEPVPGFQLVHADVEFEDELTATGLARVPGFVQEYPLPNHPHALLGRNLIFARRAVSTTGAFKQSRSDESWPRIQIEFEVQRSGTYPGHHASLLGRMLDIGL